MPGELYELLVYWGNREESADSCAIRLAEMMTKLIGVYPDFARWRMCGETVDGEVLKTPPDLDQLTRIFDENRVLRDWPREVWPDMGFSVGVHNEGKDKNYGWTFLISAGGYDREFGVPNHIFVYMSKLRRATGRPWTASELKPVVLAIVEAWDARFAAITSTRFSKIIPRNENNHYIWPWASWMTYLASPHSILTQPDEDIQVDRRPNGAMLATLCEEPFDVDNPRHLELAKEMHAALGPVQQIWTSQDM